MFRCVLHCSFAFCFVLRRVVWVLFDLFRHMLICCVVCLVLRSPCFALALRCFALHISLAFSFDLLRCMLFEFVSFCFDLLCCLLCCFVVFCFAVFRFALLGIALHCFTLLRVALLRFASGTAPGKILGEPWNADSGPSHWAYLK